ncbi:MAG: hypothetical protein ACO37W_10165 [Prochlorotrichaceae cyanobacterium]
MNNLWSDPPQRRILPTVTKTALHAPKQDAAYWRTLSYSDRLAALEDIRREYHQWKYCAEPGFQRVYSILRQPKT